MVEYVDLRMPHAKQTLYHVDAWTVEVTLLTATCPCIGSVCKEMTRQARCCTTAKVPTHISFSTLNVLW